MLALMCRMYWLMSYLLPPLSPTPRLLSCGCVLCRMDRSDVRGGIGGLMINW